MQYKFLLLSRLKRSREPLKPGYMVGNAGRDVPLCVLTSKGEPHGWNCKAVLAKLVLLVHIDDALALEGSGRFVESSYSKEELAALKALIACQTPDWSISLI